MAAAPAETLSNIAGVWTEAFETLPGVTSTTLAPGERILAVTCGGGGYDLPSSASRGVAHNARRKAGSPASALPRSTGGS